MNEQPISIAVTKSDGERVADLMSTLVGLGVLIYMLHPEPFDRFFDAVRARVEAVAHRMSVWNAIQAIRSLPDTDES